MSVAATRRTNACLAAEILMAGLAGLADLSHRGADAGAVERWCSQRRVEHGAQVAGVLGEARVFAEIAECRLQVVGHHAQCLQHGRPSCREKLGQDVLTSWGSV